MRRFYLQREVDASGVSGTGIVAQGCLFDNGKCSLTWIVGICSCTWFDSLEHIDAIHGHNGMTKIVFLDEEH